MGMERLNSLLPSIEPQKLDAYIVSNNMVEALKLAQELRAQNISVEFDLSNKKFNKQLEKASKCANYAIFLGEDELKNNNLTLKNLSTGTQTVITKKEVLKNIKNI